MFSYTTLGPGTKLAHLSLKWHSVRPAFELEHSKTQCKGSPRCHHCSDRQHDNDLPCPNINPLPTCANCKGPHASSHPACPELLIHKHAHKLAASKNISFAEAKNITRNIKNNPINNPIFDFSNFPELNDSPTPDLLYSSFHSSNPPFSYANAARKGARSDRYADLPPNSSPSSRDPNNPSSSHNLSHQKKSFNHSSLLIAPNGRTPHLSPPGSPWVQPSGHPLGILNYHHLMLPSPSPLLFHPVLIWRPSSTSFSNFWARSPKNSHLSYRTVAS